MPGPGGPHGGPGDSGGPGGHHGGPGGPGFGGGRHHRPPMGGGMHHPPMGGGMWHRPPHRRGCCGCLFPVIGVIVALIVSICVLIF